MLFSAVFVEVTPELTLHFHCYSCCFCVMQSSIPVEIYDEAFSASKLQRYRTLERLGEGTFGEVRKAVDTRSGRLVAVKFVRLLSRKGGIPKAVFREMESLKQLSQCEHIVHLFDVCADESNVCLVMEYIESDLAEVISSTKHRLHRSHLKAYYEMILRSLQHCHSRNIIHRDIKPASTCTVLVARHSSMVVAGRLS